MASGLGFATIDRGIRGWRYWTNALLRGFWLYLIIEANWKDGWMKGGSVKVPRGSLLTSFDKLAEENNISRNTVRKFLDILQEEGQITVESTHKYTLITVLKYDEYQPREALGVSNSRSPSRSDSRARNDLQSDTQSDLQSDPNRIKRIKGTKKRREEYAREASPSPARSSSESQEDEALRAELLAKLKGEL